MIPPGVVDLAWMSAVAGGHAVPHAIGTAPTIGCLPGPDGSALGVGRLSAHSAGKLDISDLLVTGGMHHAWENVYDEDRTCVFIAIGATGGR
jgi:hypothetical protein